MKKISLSILVFCVMLFVAVYTCSASDVIYGCLIKSTGLLRIVASPDDCRTAETAVELGIPTGITRVVHGTVGPGPDNVIHSGSGFTATGEKFHTITFNTSFTGLPDCTVTVWDPCVPVTLATTDDLTVACYLFDDLETAIPFTLTFICVQ